MKKRTILFLILTMFIGTISVLTIQSSSQADENQLLGTVDNNTGKGELGVDVSDVSSQRDLTKFAEKGATFAIIRTSIYADWLTHTGGKYGSDNAKYQIQSALNNGLHVMAYHGANFSDSVVKAKEEANYAVEKAKKYGVPLGSYLACDYEVKATKNIENNTTAIINFMQTVKDNGYQPLLYIGMNYANNYVNVQRVVNTFGKSIWLAQYPNGEDVATDLPNMSRLTALNVPGVAMYQYTNNWHNDDVDGDVTNIDLNNK